MTRIKYTNKRYNEDGEYREDVYFNNKKIGEIRTVEKYAYYPIARTVHLRGESFDSIEEVKRSIE